MGHGDFISENAIANLRRSATIFLGRETVDLSASTPFLNAALLLIGTRSAMVVSSATLVRMFLHLIAFVSWRTFATDYHLLLFLGMSGIAASYPTSVALHRNVRTHSLIWNFARTNQASAAPLLRPLERAIGRAYELGVYSGAALISSHVAFVVCLLADSFSLGRAAIALGLVYVEMKLVYANRLRRHSLLWQAATANVQPVAFTDESLQDVASAITGRKNPILGKTTTGRWLFSPNVNTVCFLLFVKSLIPAMAIWLYWTLQSLQGISSSAWLSSLIWFVCTVLATNLFGLVVSLSWRVMQYSRDNSCNIVVFWRFEQRAGQLARTTLTPLLSLMGMVSIVSSPYFAKKSLLERLADSSWMQAFAFPWLSPRMNVEMGELEFGSETWKPGVIQLLSQADVVLVVFTEPSLNVLWELEESVRHVPTTNIFVICPQSKRASVERFINEKMSAVGGVDAGRGLRVIPYGEHFLGRQLFKLRLGSRLRLPLGPPHDGNE